jgi:hypothetical protein
MHIPLRFPDGIGFRSRRSCSHRSIWLMGVAGKFVINRVKYCCDLMLCRRQALVGLERIAAV